MAIQLSQNDFDRLVGILSQHGEWQSVRGRIEFMGDVFAGSPRKARPRSTSVSRNKPCRNCL